LDGLLTERCLSGNSQLSVKEKAISWFSGKAMKALRNRFRRGPPPSASTAIRHEITTISDLRMALVTNLLAFRLEGFRADCRRERREQLPAPVLRGARTELVSQEGYSVNRSQLYWSCRCRPGPMMTTRPAAMENDRCPRCTIRPRLTATTPARARIDLRPRD
jgi:hypothetical protein